MTDTTDVVQRARAALDGSWEGEYAIGRLIGDLADEVEKQRAAIMRTISACVEAADVVQRARQALDKEEQG